MKIINGEKFKDLPSFFGFIVEGGHVIGKGHFRTNGFWTGAGGKHITSYYRIEDDETGEEIDAQFERSTIKGENGKTINLFYIATYDGADFNAYIEGLKQAGRA